MTQAELVARVAKEHEITKASAERIINFVGKSILTDLLLDGRSTYPGLGIFKLVSRKARAGRNPQDGTPCDIPARKTIKFKPSVPVARQINGEE